jgi:hypothetical protein
VYSWKKARFVLRTAVLSMEVSWTIGGVYSHISDAVHILRIRDVYCSLFLHQSIHRALHIPGCCQQEFHIHHTSFIHTLRTLSPKKHPLYTPARHPPFCGPPDPQNPHYCTTRGYSLAPHHTSTALSTISTAKSTPSP